MKSKYIILLTILGILSLSAFSQIDKMRDQLNDIDAEQEGLFTLRFFDAVSGMAVDDAMISIQDIGEFKSDMEGKVRFPVLTKDGTYPFSFEKEGYITANYKFVVSAGTIFYNRFSVSPVIDMGSIRIVLDWDRNPDDLDAHLIKEGDYHISYHNMKVSDDGSARLDRDDRDGYGPETITIKDIDDEAEYLFYVKDYSNRNDKSSKAISKSKATVRIYGEGMLMDEYEIGDKLKGNAWKVFSIVNGKLVSIDLVGYYY